MDKLILLVGESGSGKTTVAYELQKIYGWNVIESYTTRPKRSADEKGHIFADRALYREHKKNDLKDMFGIIAETYFDNNYYWATKEQYQGKGISLYVIDPVGVNDILKNVKDAEVKIIYLKVDGEKRISRMYKRDGYSAIDNPVTAVEHDKVSIRFKHDEQAFKIVKCNYVVDANRPLNEVIEIIKECVENE